MISQVLLLALGLCSTWSYPQTYQFQRQVVYSPPVLAGAPPLVPQPLLAVHPQANLPKTEPALYLQNAPAYVQQEQPVVYVYSPDGGMVYLRPRDGQRQQGSFVDTILGFFQNPSQYLPWGPTNPEKPAESPEGPAPAQPEKPEKLQEEQPASSGASPNVGVPAVVAPQQRFYVGQQLAPLVPSTHHFSYRLQNQPTFDQAHIDALGERAGTAALAFQKYLALAKLQKQGQRGEEGLTVEAGNRDGNSDDETTTAGATTTEQSDTETIDGQEMGPSIAQAKPHAVSVAGPGGVAAAAPVGTAVVGPGGMALSAPSATAVAGAKGPRPGSQTKIRAYFKQANLPGYFVQY